MLVGFLPPPGRAPEQGRAPKRTLHRSLHGSDFNNTWCVCVEATSGTTPSALEGTPAGCQGHMGGRRHRPKKHERPPGRPLAPAHPTPSRVPGCTSVVRCLWCWDSAGPCSPAVPSRVQPCSSWVCPPHLLTHAGPQVPRSMIPEEAGGGCESGQGPLSRRLLHTRASQPCAVGWLCPLWAPAGS